MLHVNGPRTRIVVAGALVAVLTNLASCSSSSPSTTGPAASTPPPVTKPATFLGPLLSTAESSTLALGRDGGITVPLPNGKAFWIFGDTPTYTFKEGTWKLTNFIQGSTAGIGEYNPGRPPSAPFEEVVVGSHSTPGTQPAQFLPPPVVYLPDGSGKLCTKANGGPSAGAVRWASGAALLPDGTNIFVPYIDACVITAASYRAEGWGFALYNWKTNTFAVPPTDVVVPKKSAEAISTAQYFGSPVVDGKKLTMFSATCCAVGSGVYYTTMDANVATFKNPDSYYPRLILGVPATFVMTVAPPSPTQPHLSMYELTGLTGEYRILTAANAAGPWVQRATGTLPKCDASPAPCNNSIYIHPELSSTSKLLVSYWLPGFGPGIAEHPDASGKLYHLVLASVPV